MLSPAFLPKEVKWLFFDSCYTRYITVLLTIFYVKSLINKMDWKVWVLGRLCDFS